MPRPASTRLGIHLREVAPCRLGQNAYTVPQAVDPRPTSSAFPQRKPTAEAKGGILPDQHGEPSLSRGLGCWGARLLALRTKEISPCRSTKISSASFEDACKRLANRTRPPGFISFRSP